MSSRRVFAVSCVFLFVLSATAQPAPDLRETTNRLAGSIYTGPSMNTLRELTDSFGGRLTGSPAYQRAAEWAAAKFRASGIKNVRLEPFTLPNGWQRGPARGQMLSPMSRTLHLESVAWSPSTPLGGVQGEVVVAGDLAEDKIKSQAAQLKGRVVMLDTKKIYADGYFKALPRIHASYDLFKNAGVLAVISPDRTISNVLNAQDTFWGAQLSSIPVAQLGMEDSQLIQRLLEQGPVTIQFELNNIVSGPTQVNDVVAEIRGSERPEEWILIGAHFDSWDYGTGAQDNGTGSAMVLEAARALMALGKPPRRSIRFALWGGEEQGLLGSYAYTQAHAHELDKCIAVLNTDSGAGHPRGWKVDGRKDVQDAMQPLSDSLLKDLSAGDLSMDLAYDTDDGPFVLQGVPALDLWVDTSHYGEIHHKSSDTFDKVDALNFKADAAVVAVTAFAIAQSPKPIAPRLDHAAVGELIKKAGIDELVTQIGQWKP